MKKFFIILIIFSLFISLLQAQGKKEEKEIVIKKTEIRQIEVDQIKMGEYILTPKSIEEIINAGEQLRGYRNNTYKNMLVGFLGGIFMSIGTNSDSSENNFLFFAGSVTVIYAGIAQIININKIGKAGEHLERSVRVKKSVKAK